MAGMRDYTDDKLALVRKSFSGRYALCDRCFFEMALQMGLRVSEMLSLSVGQVYQYGKVVEEVSIERKYMKGGQGRQSQRSHNSPLPRDSPPYLGLARAHGSHAQGEGPQGDRSRNPALSLSRAQ
jgi:hypothetical protein